MSAASSSSSRPLHRLSAMCGAFAIAVLAGCATPPPPPPPPPVVVELSAPHQISTDQPNFLTLPNIAQDRTPVRVGVILPFGDASAGTRTLAGAMMKAAELALYDAGKTDIVLMTAEETGQGNDAAKAAQTLLDQGAEIIIGPVFSASAAAVAPLARDRGVPVLTFSTNRTVAGDGVFLLSFQPQSEVERVVAYAAGQGHKKFAGLIPQTAYGDVVEQSFRDAVKVAGGEVVELQRYNPAVGAVNDPAAIVAKSRCDAIFVPQGGSLLRALIPALAYNGVDNGKVKYLGTGLWDDPANTKESLLAGGWFAAPQPSADDAFKERYLKTFGIEAPPLASLAYDAVSLVALLSAGTPYHRYTKATIADPNGFAGANGIFRFKPDGTIERGLAVLSVDPSGFILVSPAPTTFLKIGS